MKYHDDGIGKHEIKYTHLDGREAVFNGDTLEPMTDPRYEATYNFCPIRQLPEDPKTEDHILHDLKWWGHGVDVVPYLIWGTVRMIRVPLLIG